MHTQPPVLLLAGCGKLGIRLAHNPTFRAWDIIGLRRTTDALPSRIKPWAADLTQPDSLLPPTSFSHVLYSATPPQYDEATYLATYRDGLQHVIAMLQAQSTPPQRFVLVSSTSVYPQDDGSWIDEDSEASPTHYAGAAIREGERLLEQSGLPYTIIRFGGIYGPQRTQAMLDRILQQRISQTAGAVRYTNRIHEDDCIGALAHLLTHPHPAPLYLGVDSHPAPRNEVITWLAQQLGVPVPTVKAEAASSRRPFNNKRCSNQRLRESGYQFLYQDYQQGYTSILAQRKAAQTSEASKPEPSGSQA